ncbi:hypothetical protein NFI96_018777, partial [Prochilodus magdalenae]
ALTAPPISKPRVVLWAGHSCTSLGYSTLRAEWRAGVTWSASHSWSLRVSLSRGRTGVAREAVLEQTSVFCCRSRAMLEVSIPSLERDIDESGKLRKLFRVEILFNGRKHFVLRRQSEFQTLHRKLKKVLQLPDFPSKRTQHLRTKPLEQRRQELEDYIQVILYQNEVVPQELLDFLQVKHFHHSTNKLCSFHEEEWDDSQEQGYSCQLLHQRVVGFSGDPYLLASASDLPDMVVAGVLQGLYPRDTKVSFKGCCKPGINSAPLQPRHAAIPSIVIDRGSLSSLPETRRT